MKNSRDQHEYLSKGSVVYFNRRSHQRVSISEMLTWPCAIYLGNNRFWDETHDEINNITNITRHHMPDVNSVGNANSHWYVNGLPLNAYSGCKR